LRIDLNALGRCAIAPPLVLVAFTMISLAAAPFGGHPLWHDAELNMSEAAAARDVATVAALIERGEDPDAVRHVRQPLLEGAVQREVTPLEAAVIAGRLEVVHLLLTHGAAVPDAARLRLSCEAARSGYRDVAEYLFNGRLPDTCP
jgi:hypothetical protein